MTYWPKQGGATCHKCSVCTFLCRKRGSKPEYGGIWRCRVVVLVTSCHSLIGYCSLQFYDILRLLTFALIIRNVCENVGSNVKMWNKTGTGHISELLRLNKLLIGTSSDLSVALGFVPDQKMYFYLGKSITVFPELYLVLVCVVGSSVTLFVFPSVKHCSIPMSTDY